MNYEILTALRTAAHNYDGLDYRNGVYGFAVTELGRYMDAMWDIGRTT